MVALLISRTKVLKYDKEQKVQAHDDGVRMLQNVTEYLKSLVPPSPSPHQHPNQAAVAINHQTSALRHRTLPPFGHRLYYNSLLLHWHIHTRPSDPISRSRV